MPDRPHRSARVQQAGHRIASVPNCGDLAPLKSRCHTESRQWRYGEAAPEPTFPERSFERVSSTRRATFIPSNRMSRIDVLRTSRVATANVASGQVTGPCPVTPIGAVSARSGPTTFPSTESLHIENWAFQDGLCARLSVQLGALHERDPKNSSDPGGRRGRLQPARERGRGPHLGAAEGAAQRPHRSDDLGSSWPRREAHRRWRHRRVPQHAVRCAIEIQNAMVERNAGVPEDRRIEFRIGVHLGDVVEEADGDLMGDGVNIAARLEGIAEPGAICLSEDAYRQVRARLDLAVGDLGERQLKNIAEPVRVYSLQVGRPAQAKPEPAVEQAAPARLALPDRPSIAVLPFQNMSGDPEQDYFCDGMVEDIVTGLSRIKWLFVIARNSTFIYKGRAVDVKQAGRELGVRYVLEGSVRKAADRVRITGQLIDATSGHHVWADRYDGAIDN